MQKLLVLAALAALCACDRNDSEDHGRAATRAPRATGAVASAGELTGAALVERPLAIDLATAPNPAVSWATEACAPVLAPETAIGEATCVADGRRTQIRAAHARQTCSADPAFGAPVGPVETLGLPGCERLALGLYVFTPAITVEAP